MSKWCDAKQTAIASRELGYRHVRLCLEARRAINPILTSFEIPEDG